MHGRLKVRTTEEQKLLKQKEQQQKLLEYRKGLKFVLTKRYEKPYNKESFTISGCILEKNPDVYTLWNYRKEVLEQEIEDLNVRCKKIRQDNKTWNQNFFNTIVQTLVSCNFLEAGDDIAASDLVGLKLLWDKMSLEKNKDLDDLVKEAIKNVGKVFFLIQDDGVEEDTELKQVIFGLVLLHEFKFSLLMNKELRLTENCLLVNPKSYGTWHHRYWVLQHYPNVNTKHWKNELKLIEKYLGYDDRNFHTWDYRRLVLSKIDANLDKELEFSTDRINTNFSNYSSWHYRSTLLVLNAETLQNELQMVQHAVFTDPYDSSTWFYLHWLLSNKEITNKHCETLLDDFEQLLEMEPDCKWVYMAKCWITGSLSLLNKEEIKKNTKVYQKLKKLDPLRRGMYQDYIKICEAQDE